MMNAKFKPSSALNEFHCYKCDSVMYPHVIEYERTQYLGGLHYVTIIVNGSHRATVLACKDCFLTTLKKGMDAKLEEIRDKALAEHRGSHPPKSLSFWRKLWSRE